MQSTEISQTDATAVRRDWMGELARSGAGRLAALWAGLGRDPAFAWLRPPETGTVMVRGRAGATGDAFNLGELTVTRCALRLADGRVGHGWVQGRDGEKARLAALCDALLQGPEAAEVEAGILTPLRAEAADRAAHRAGRAAATKVDFFTMVRGED